jgi:hypothetical protein
MGIVKPKSVIQIDSMDDDLTIGLWNVLTLTAFNQRAINEDLYYDLWLYFFKWAIDDYPSSPYDNVLKYFRDWYFDDQTTWYQKYDFVEFNVQNIELDTSLSENLNSVLEDELSGYRFVEEQLIPIINEEQLKSIEIATHSERMSTAHHIQNALNKLANRKNPDYRTVIKESIDAVEDMCTQITKADPNAKDQDTLGKALKEIEKHSGIGIHPSLNAAFSKIYGYASDGGIRHAQGDNAPPDQETAIFMLVSCSAFVNYLQVKADKAGINLK